MVLRRNRRQKSPEQQEQEHLETGRRKHRRDLRFRIIGPIVLCELLIVGAALVVLAARGSDPLNAVAALMSVFVFFPVIIVLLILYSLLVVVAFGASRASGGLSGMLRRVHYAARRANLTVKRIAPRVAAPVVAFNARFAWLERFIDAVTRPEPTAIIVVPPGSAPDRANENRRADERHELTVEK